MKTLQLPESSANVREFLDLAADEPILVQVSGGRTFAVREIDDGGIEFGTGPIAIPRDVKLSEDSPRKMSQVLALELPDEVYGRLAEVARRSGMTVEQWTMKRLRPFLLSPEERKQALEQLMRFAGSTESTHGTADNESIDRDLAEEALDSHEEK